MAAVYSQRMSVGLRSAVIMTFGLLWLSGCLWLVLHYFFARAADFGSVPHPWEPVILRIHGWIAVASVFLLGWVTAGHVTDRWPQMTKRVSGVGMAGVAAVLGCTGYALYYTTDGLHDAAAVTHEAVGAAALLFALTHWRRYRPAGRSSRHIAA